MTDLRAAAQQALEAWDSTVLPKSHDGMMQERMESLRSALAESEPPKTPWAHLPNAVHIDRILAHAKEHPRKWAAAWNAAWDAAGRAFRDDALSLSWAVVLRACRDKAWNEAWDATWSGDSSHALESLLALITWDDAGELLSLPIEAVRAMADEGDHAAILIYPAMLAMGEEK